MHCCLRLHVKLLHGDEVAGRLGVLLPVLVQPRGLLLLLAALLELLCCLLR